MILKRSAAERGHFDHGWLDTWHTFSFGDYHEPEQMGFRHLRVLNEDRVQPAKGFATHSHWDMEIVTLVLEGALEHKDDLGNGSIIRPGDVQRMTAGTGVTHSEFNHSQEDLVHFLQIWIVPDRKDLQPGYEQRSFPAEGKQGRLRRIISPEGRDDTIAIHQNVSIFDCSLEAGASARHVLRPGRQAWVQIASGAVEINGVSLEAGDGAAVSDEGSIDLSASSPSELFLLELT